MSEEKRGFIDKLWQELVEAQRAKKQQAEAEKLTAEIERQQREERLRQERDR